MIPPIASRFLAGETAAEAIGRVRELDERGVGTILNLLGEHYHERSAADEDTEAYLALIDDLSDQDARGCISIKPSQVGLGVGADAGPPTAEGREVFRENVGRIVDAAREGGVFVWFDMENHTTTDATLDAYEELARKHGDGVGVCVQANLKRAEADVHRLADVPGKVRLVKGAYDEPADIAYTEKEQVNEAFRELVRTAFEEFDEGVAVGSHDPEMIDLTLELAERYDTGFEIQMLMGVREDAQFELAEEYDVWQYVPYGTKWKSYFYRRMMERKENVLFALRAILGTIFSSMDS